MVPINPTATSDTFSHDGSRLAIILKPPATTCPDTDLMPIIALVLSNGGFFENPLPVRVFLIGLSTWFILRNVYRYRIAFLARRAEKRAGLNSEIATVLIETSCYAGPPTTNHSSRDVFLSNPPPSSSDTIDG